MSLITDNVGKMAMDVKAVVLGLMATASVALLPGAASAAKLDDVLARGKLVVGTGSTNAPWHFKDASDTLQGFDVDMAKIVAKALFGDAEKVEFVNQSSDARIPNITTGKVDMTCQFMTVTGERAQQVNFTIPYYREGVGLMLKEGGQYADYAALKAAALRHDRRFFRTSMPKSSSIRRCPRRASISTSRRTSLPGTSIGPRGRGRHRPVVHRWYVTQNPGQYKDAGYGWSPQTYACAVAKGDQDWLNFVNTALHEAMTGVEFDTYAASFKKWFGKVSAASGDRLPRRVQVIT